VVVAVAEAVAAHGKNALTFKTNYYNKKPPYKGGFLLLKIFIA
jgi:hypothetical protein